MRKWKTVIYNIFKYRKGLLIYMRGEILWTLLRLQIVPVHPSKKKISEFHEEIISVFRTNLNS